MVAQKSKGKKKRYTCMHVCDHVNIYIKVVPKFSPIKKLITLRCSYMGEIIYKVEEYNLWPTFLVSSFFL